MSGRNGVVTAFVHEVDARHGRVRVEYRGIEDRLLSPWASIASPMSGNGRGALFMPEEGDEVLVCFGDGHFEHPYVVGFLWNGEHTSPERDAQNRVIVTPGGHQLRFEDRREAARVVLRSNGGREVVLDDAPGLGKVEVRSGRNTVVLDDTPAGTKIQLQAGDGAGVTITLNATPQPSLSILVGAGNVIDVGASGITLTTPAAITLATTGAANVSAGGAVTVTAGGPVAITAAGPASLTATAVSVTAPATKFTGIVTASAFVVAP